MTEELRQKANEYHKQIEDTQNRLNILLDMRDSGNVLTLHDSEIGSIALRGELKQDTIDMVEHTLTEELLRLQKEFDEL